MRARGERAARAVRAVHAPWCDVDGGRRQAKMRAEGLSDAAILAFRHSYMLLSSGATGMIPESDIQVCSPGSQGRRSLPMLGGLVPTHAHALSAPPLRLWFTGLPSRQQTCHPWMRLRAASRRMPASCRCVRSLPTYLAPRLPVPTLPLPCLASPLPLPVRDRLPCLFNNHQTFLKKKAMEIIRKLPREQNPASKPWCSS